MAADFTPPPGGPPLSDVKAVAIGTGRFMRGIVIPAVLDAVGDVIIAQTRGSSFSKKVVDSWRRRQSSGETSTGLTFEVATSSHTDDANPTLRPCRVVAVGTLDTEDGRQAFVSLPPQLPALRLLLVGIQPSEVQPDSPAMRDLGAFLRARFQSNGRALSVVDTSFDATGDSDGEGGTRLAKVVRAVCAASSEDERFLRWVITDVTFHNCVPESAVSVYPRDVTVPLVEAPLSTASSLSDGAPPLDLSIALKIEDVASVLPESLGNTQKTGILLRRTRGQIQRDAELRRLVAGTVRAALAPALVLSGARIIRCPQGGKYLKFIEQLYSVDMGRSSAELSLEALDAYFVACSARLQQPVGLAQSCLAECGANATANIIHGRLMRVASRALDAGSVPSAFLAYATAATLRFLTPTNGGAVSDDGVFLGSLDSTPLSGAATKRVEHQPGLHVDWARGEYEFKDGDGSTPRALATNAGVRSALRRKAGTAVESEADDIEAEVRAIRMLVSNCLFGARDLDNIAQAEFAAQVAYYLHLMLTGQHASDVLEMALDEFSEPLRPGATAAVLPSPAQASVKRAVSAPIVVQGPSMQAPLSLDEVVKATRTEVASANGTDYCSFGLRPPTHSRVRAGIDALLSSTPLVEEYMITAPSRITLEGFDALPLRTRAEHVWNSLFKGRACVRSPQSDACLRVISALDGLGLRDQLARRDLAAIQAYFDRVADGAPRVHTEKLLAAANLDHCVCACDIFSPTDAHHWKHSAGTAEESLGGIADIDGEGGDDRKPARARFRCSLGVSAFAVGMWSVIESTLQLFEYECSLVGAKSYLRDMISSTQPEFLVAWTAEDSAAKPAPGTNCIATAETDVLRNAQVSGLEILQAVLLPIAEEHSLPLAVGLAGDTTTDTGDSAGIVVASASVLKRLLAENPRVKFIIVVDGSVTSKALALAKNRNAHLVLRKPSIAALEFTLGAIGCAFTVASGDDLRVIEEIAGEWHCIRRNLTNALAGRYEALVGAGWTLCRAEIAQDLRLLLGGALDEFTAR